MKTRWTVYLMAFAVLGLLGHAYFKYVVPHWSETQDIRRKVDRLRRIPRSDVVAMILDLDVNQGLTLRRPEDDRYIDELLSSLRRMTVLDAVGGVNHGGLILVIVKDHPYNSEIRIEGRFDPDDSFVSEALRSDDLGRIVHGIFKRKGLEPREGKPER